MNFQFEIHTTISEPMHICIEIKNTTLKQLRCKILEEIEKNTTLTEGDIMDIFVNDTLSTNTLTLPTTDQKVKDFIPMNRSFFPYDSVEKNIYKIYAIDIMCGERLKKNLHDLQLENENKRKIKTSHFEGIRNLTKKLNPAW